jgi:type IX secretion system PorP/SprF family membrane protein
MTSDNFTFLPEISFLMRPYFWLLLIFSTGANETLQAQEQSNFTQFYLNPYLINSSYAGVDGQTVFSLIYKRQWMGVEGGPAIANVSMHTPVNERTSVGFSITNDKKGLLNNSGILFSLAYSLPVAEHSFVRFGLSGGGSWNTIDLKKFESNTDPALASLLNKNASLLGTAGISFQHKFYNIGVAVPSLFSPAYVSKDAFTITEVKPFQSLIFNTSYRFYFNNNQNVFEPYAVYRMNTGLPSQFELAGLLHLNHVVWVGGSYKQDFGISAVGGIKLQNMLAIGGAYTLKNSGINELNSPSFEVSLSYLIGKRKKGVHAVSFVNTVKEKEKKTPLHPSASEAILAKRKQDEELHKKQLETQAKQREDAATLKKKQGEELLAKQQAEKKTPPKEVAKEPIKEVVKEPVKKEPVVIADPPKKKDSVVVTHNPRFRSEMMEGYKVTEEVTADQEKETIERLSTHAENPTEHHGLDPSLHPHAERHEFVKKGNHPEELDVSDYVVGGVFKSDVNAKHFSDGLKKLGFKAHYGHLTEKTLWYVYLSKTDDINKAKEERDRFRKMKLFRDAWLLTVHN